MNIIVFPLDNWNSFVTVAEADDIMSAITTDDSWSKLQGNEKEILLVNSALYLRSIATPSTTCDFKTAQVVLIQFDLANGNSLLSFVIPLNQYKRVSVGSISVEYVDALVNSKANSIPFLVKGLLRDCLIDNGGVGVVEGFEIV